MRSHSTLIPIFGLLALVATGCSQHTRPGNLSRVRAVSDQPRAGNAYLLRGFIGIFSSGIDELTRQINQAGIRAHVYQDDQWLALARKIRREYSDAPDAEPLVLIGHSYGADDVIRIARELDKAGVPVDLLVTLDPVTPPPVPKNVRQAVNIYQSNGMWDSLPWLRGVSVRADRGFAGRLDNFDIRGDRRDLLGPKTDHFNIEKQPQVHEEVIGHLIATCPPRATWLASRHRGAPAPGLLNDPLDDAQTAGHRLGN
jgi:hypothetical protein